ncbi:MULTISPECIES: hypothetical protein [Paraburkholderia]|uniref:DUF3022 domain-containing protein n=1 Tax=Paraburkholderia youngii TaxID=2782701 RepID=A0A7Y6K7M2_9BURK|nr:hypothetical protein [Paraburkholderia youngii]NUY04618.1 hypothetical protein [Paraburkholderia youngii]
MPIYQITRSVLERVAQAVSRSFHDDAIYSEEAAADGRLNVLLVRNPAGPDTPYISLRFPGDLLGRLETLGPKQTAIVGNHIRNIVSARLAEYRNASDAGTLSRNAPFPIEFDERIFDDTAGTDELT